MSYYCSECELECTPNDVDFGIGPYEFHGQRGHHREMTLQSDCCEAEVVDHQGNSASYDEWKADEDANFGDYLREIARDRQMEDAWENECHFGKERL